MKEYLKITLPVADKDTQEILIALLAEEGYDSFEEKENELSAFIVEEQFNEEILRETLLPFGLTYIVEKMIQQNWNAVWESNFQPVQIANWVGIRAHFHPPFEGIEHEIVITPKMSFGTGHHATTYLMLEAMKKIDLKDKTVIDFGTGTGILAIMAGKLGAAKVYAIDNDEWSVENATENIQRNDCHIVDIGLAEDLGELPVVNVILANINKHIILEKLASIKQHLKEGGILLLSGLLKEDETDIQQALNKVGIKYMYTNHRDKWICMKCVNERAVQY